MRIAAYCRVSTDKSEQLDSLKHQMEFFEGFARKGSHELVGVYADEGISGTSLKKRTEFARLMRDAERGAFEIVVAKDISRFARNTVDFLQSIRKLRSLGINTLFLTANMETLGESEFILTVFSALAQEESVNLSKRVKFGKKINARKGRVPTRIFGYDRKDNFTLEINLAEAETVRYIYRLYLSEGLGVKSICERLNAEQHKTKLGCEWSARSVRRVLTNPIYCGEYINNKYETVNCLEGKQIRLPPEQNIHHERPQWAMISRAEFDAVQMRMSERRGQYASAASQTQARQSQRHLFSNLIQCARCDRSFYRKRYTHAKERIYWKCGTNDRMGACACDNGITVSEEWLIEKLSSYLSSLVEDRTAFSKMLASEVEQRIARAAQSAQSSRQAQLERLGRKRDKFLELFADGVISEDELKEKLSAVEGELERLLSRCAESDCTSGVQGGEYLSAIENFLSLRGVTNAELKKLIKRITVDRDGAITVYWRSYSEQKYLLRDSSRSS